MTKQEKIEAKMIDDVIENFDFLRCHYVMKFLNWRWVHNDNKVPTINELKSAAKKRFETNFRNLEIEINVLKPLKRLL